MFRGTFTSSRYPGYQVSGKIYAKISPDFQSADFMVMYTGLYRLGDQVVFHVTIEPGQRSINTSQTTYTFKGSSLVQNITFTAEVMTNEKISGTYYTTNPADDGTFDLSSGSVEGIEFKDVTNLGGCSIL